MTGRQARGPIIARAVKGSFPGTAEVVRSLIDDSMAPPVWRPVRAVAAMAAAQTEDQVWMTLEEAERWFAQHFPPRRRTGGETMEWAVGISPHRRKAILAGARILKMEAMAMAHYALFGSWTPLPYLVEPAAFSAWVLSNFGAAKPASEALGRKRSYVTERMAGYALVESGRVARQPDTGLIRALDWLLRVGPFSPYGDHPAVAYPGQGA